MGWGIWDKGKARTQVMGGRESGISGDLKVGYAWASAPHSCSKP